MTFEFDGREYAEASTHQKEWGEKLVSELNLKGNERILDLGCGDGSITLQLAELVPDGSVLGIDASQGMIEAARNHQRHNLSFMLRDINSLDLKDEFDLVFSNATLHWIKDHDRLPGATHACLKENGALRFNFAADGNCSHFISVVKAAIRLPQYSRYFSELEWPWFMPRVEEYEAVVRQFRFRDIRVWGEIADRYFRDSETMAKWIDQPSLVPFLRCLDEADKQSFRDFVVERMIEETQQHDGTCFETFRRVNVFARKLTDHTAVS